MRKYLQNLLLRLENVFNAPFGQAQNPWYHLGAITFFLFWTVVASGIYLYAFYRTGVAEAYQSVERLTHDQWYAGGVIRSLHRYASDGMVVTMLLHLLRNFITGRFHSFRWFSWVSGVLLIWLVYICGINGYWMVWDRLAQFIAVGTAEWFDWLPLFSQPLARNFLAQDDVNDRFFTLLSFGHITIPLVLLLFMWIHTKRMNHAETNPPLRLAAGTLLALLVLALIKPALSHAHADLALAPGVIRLDWFYLAPYPLLYIWSPGAVWALVGGITLLLLSVPWFLKPRTRPAVAEVHLDNCNGCSNCAEDCPYSAIMMRPRQDGRPYALQPVVDPNLCASCGICTGACPYSMPFRSDELVSGIELPGHELAQLRADVDRALAGLRGDVRVMVFGCNCACDVRALQSEGVAALSLPCVGMLPPAFIDYVLRDARVDGVMVAGCREGDCQYRLGIRWTKLRLARQRLPHLRRRVPLQRIEYCWAGVQDDERARATLAALRARIAQLPQETVLEDDARGHQLKPGDKN
ncbi:MAG: cytochrome b N-terminal domain-containing protein [Betaproteobacteria bacterium]|nr:cytochrome b N-terminal domain-containing protein [Betaproteobacteria bacterium]